MPATNNGLYQSGKFQQAIAYRHFKERLSEKNGFRYYWDDVAKAPYSYNATEKKFATYDDERSIELKTKYTLDNKLGGIMFWEISNDLYQGGLTDVIYKTKNNYREITKRK